MSNSLDSEMPAAFSLPRVECCHVLQPTLSDDVLAFCSAKSNKTRQQTVARGMKLIAWNTLLYGAVAKRKKLVMLSHDDSKDMQPNYDI